ncbi:MAG: hypothetical protein ACRDC6_32960, partial [Shewanella sp.]
GTGLTTSPRSSLDYEELKDNGQKTAKKGCRRAPQLAGSPIFPLLFKIGEPSCLATLKMT